MWASGQRPAAELRCSDGAPVPPSTRLSPACAASPESCRDRPPNHPPCGPLRAKLWPQPVMTSARPKSRPRSPSRRRSIQQAALRAPARTSL
ncbi:unnamed protein product [Rangifer tarandus platyrhynchus]|uniref:Uncharacterized protein n=1 Tax=Rangifer tarandus platyrhynchus TaxID=3082113 RepID=A0AC59ZQX1_RANTA